MAIKRAELKNRCVHPSGYPYRAPHETSGIEIGLISTVSERKLQVIVCKNCSCLYSVDVTEESESTDDSKEK